MWDHLLNLTEEKQISIILTTHYIEEARAAHVVSKCSVVFEYLFLFFILKIH